MKRIPLVILVLAALIVVVGCGAEPTPEPFESPLGLPNPASQYCLDQGYDLELRQEADGVVGYCLFPDGTECEEWAFYRDECEPGTPKP